MVDSVEFQENSQINISIAARMQKIIDKNPDVIEDSSSFSPDFLKEYEEYTGRISDTTLYNPNFPGHTIYMSSAEDEKSREKKISEFALVPEKFKFPVISLFEEYSLEERHRVRTTTPYGRMPEYIIGADGLLYRFNNIYFFNKFGQAVKLEDVTLLSKSAQSLTKDLQDTGLQDEVDTVDFVPNIEDSRCIDLEPGDYEKILGFLQQIETGILVNKFSNKK